MNHQGCSLENSNQHHELSVKYGVGFALFQCMKKYSSRPLQYIADTDEVDTYEQVLSRCTRTALRLKEKGLTRDDVLSTCTHNHKNSVVPYIAAMFLGIKTAHFDPALSPLDTIHLLRLVKPKIIFVDIESLPSMERCLKESKVDTELVVFGETTKYSNFLEYIAKHVEEENFRPVAIDNVKETAVIKFSSGTTGLLKGICLNHYGLLHIFQPFEDCGEKVCLGYATFYWISATTALLRCITEGAAKVVCKKFEADIAWRLIEKYQVKSMFLPAYHTKDFVASYQKSVDTRCLKYFWTGASSITAKLMEDLRKVLPTTNVLQGYGQTEATTYISSFNPTDPKDLVMQIKKPLSCGKIPSFFTWKVVDPITEKKLGPNERGELRYKSDYIFNGYYNMDSSSAFDTEGFVKSGDIVYYDEEGCLFVVDRIKETFKYKGWHIFPSLLEEVLLNHPAIKDVAVIGVPHDVDGNHPMGIVTLKEGYEDVSPVDIQQYMDELVSETQRLRAGVKIVYELPRTATGKIKRNALKEMVLNGEIRD